MYHTNLLSCCLLCSPHQPVIGQISMMILPSLPQRHVCGDMARLLMVLMSWAQQGSGAAAAPYLPPSQTSAFTKHQQMSEIDKLKQELVQLSATTGEDLNIRLPTPGLTPGTLAPTRAPTHSVAPTQKARWMDRALLKVPISGWMDAPMDSHAGK